MTCRDKSKYIVKQYLLIFMKELADSLIKIKYLIELSLLLFINAKGLIQNNQFKL